VVFFAFLFRPELLQFHHVSSIAMEGVLLWLDTICAPGMGHLIYTIRLHVLLVVPSSYL
jgi:hypothetical protein